MDETPNPLADWCRALEARLEEALHEKTQLAAENERLLAQLRDFKAVLKSFEEAYLLGRMRATGHLPAKPDDRTDSQPPTKIIYPGGK